MKQKADLFSRIMLLLFTALIILALYMILPPSNIKDYVLKISLSLFTALTLIIFSLHISRYFENLKLPYSKNFSNLIYVLSFIVASLIVLKIWGIDTTILLQSSVLLGLILV